MKPIKFRVWDLNDLSMWRWKDMLKIPINVFFENYKTDRFILMQYTGLNDKNGKEIYEGDKLGGILDGLHIVFCKNCKQYQAFVTETNECMGCLGDMQWCEIVNDNNLEIIGNIYENPEILKED